MVKIMRAEPRAASLIESMRDLGYSLETALADIIDNSITAEAPNIDIIFEASDAAPWVAIVDDGNGMSSDELFEAMRPGTKSPLETRAEDDLGRFGLGLKTASFSQCRKVTVVTRKQGALSAARWDLDLVASENEWLLQLLDNSEAMEVHGASLLGKTGTLVLWENLDRLSDVTSGTNLKDHLYERLDSAQKHLSLIFHRYLEGVRPISKVQITINNVSIEPFDPFNSNHPATQHLPKDIVQVEGHKVTIQPYILPHHKKIKKLEYDRCGWEGGYLKNQGFYVYRNNRLIIHGTWFRLARQSELTKLARVRVDMPPGLDHLWKIDVKKASAQPPFSVRQHLKRIIEQITGASGRVYTSRGRRLLDPEVNSLWVRRIDKNEITYEINREHPILEHFLSLLEEEQLCDFKAVLKVVEQCFPVDAFFSDTASNPETLGRTEIPEEILRQLLDVALELYKGQGMKLAEITSTLAKTEPYRSQMDTVNIILGEKGGEADGL